MITKNAIMRSMYYEEADKIVFTGSTGQKLIFYPSAAGMYGLAISPYQLNYVASPSPGNAHVFYQGGTNNDGTELARIYGNGNFEIKGSTAYKPGGGSFTATSDLRYKKSYTYFDNEAASVSVVMNLKPMSYIYNDEIAAQWQCLDKVFYGYGAQDLLTVCPEAVVQRDVVLRDGEEQVTVEYEENGEIKTAVETQPLFKTLEGVYQVEDDAIKPHLVVALKSALRRIEVLETEVAALKGSV